jgi:hypothetical protein
LSTTQVTAATAAIRGRFSTDFPDLKSRGSSPLKATHWRVQHVGQHRQFAKGVVSAGKVENGNLGLQVIAAQSGGLVLNTSNDIASLIANPQRSPKTGQ